MRSDMNRTFVRVFGIGLVLSLVATPVVKAAEEHDGKKSRTESSRTSAKEEIFPAKYDELLKKLDKEIKFGTLAADKNENNKLKNSVGGKNEFLKTQIEEVKKYRESLKDCSQDAEKKLAEILDGYIESLLSGFNTEVKKESSGNFLADGIDKFMKGFASSLGLPAHVISEKVVNTYTLQIRELLAAKAKKHDKSKEDFEAEDKQVLEALNKIAGALWNGKEEGKFRETVFDSKAAEADESTKSIVEATNKAKALVKKSENACGLKEKVSSDSGSDSETDSGKDSVSDTKQGEGKTAKQDPAGSKKDEAGPDKEVKDPTVSDTGGQGGGKQGGSGGAGAGAGGGGGGAGLGGPGANDPTLNPAVNAGVLDLQNGLLALQDALRNQEALRAADQAALQALAQQNRDNSDLAARLAEAAGQQPQANRSANRENTEGSPSISPSLTSPSGGQGEQTPPPQMPQQQMPPPLPASMFQPPPTQPLPPSMYGEPKKWDEEPVRRPPVVVPDPQTQGILELLKMQQQMMMMAQQQRAMTQPGVPNVNSVSGRLTGFAPRRSVSVTRTRTGGRMNGTASSGMQGNISVNSRARTTAPK